MPPLHPHCRSTIVGSLKGDSTPKGSRAARDRVGKYIRVPADMKYEEWYNEYVHNTSTYDLVGIRTSNNIVINGLSKHQQERADERALKINDVKDALINPLHIENVRVDKNGKSQRFIGKYATVNVNPDTGIVITSWRTGKGKVKKYEQSDGKRE